MPVVNLKDLLRHAQATQSALPAVVVDSVADALEAVSTAERLESPLVVEAADNAFADLGADIAMPAVEALATRSRIPVALQSGRVGDERALAAAIRLGFCGITIGGQSGGDAEMWPKLARVAADCGATVKLATAGPANDDFGRLSAMGVDVVELPFEAASAWLTRNEKRGDAEQDPRPAIAVTVPPHQSFEALQKMTADGVAWMSRVPEAASTTEGSGAVAETTVAVIRDAGSGGRAAEFARNCRHWVAVEHVVAFNAPEIEPTEIDRLFALGTRQLGAIPGVRHVATGIAIRDEARYRLCWFIRFASPDVVASFRDHPDHVAFADGHFRPVAGDRLTTDYVLRPAP